MFFIIHSSSEVVIIYPDSWYKRATPNMVPPVRWNERHLDHQLLQPPRQPLLGYVAKNFVLEIPGVNI